MTEIRADVQANTADAAAASSTISTDPAACSGPAPQHQQQQHPQNSLPANNLLLDLPGPALQLVLLYTSTPAAPGICWLAPVCKHLRQASTQLTGRQLHVSLVIGTDLVASSQRVQAIRATTPVLLYQPALAAVQDAMEEAQQLHQQAVATALFTSNSLAAWLVRHGGSVEALLLHSPDTTSYLPTAPFLEEPILHALLQASTQAAAAGPVDVAAVAEGKEGSHAAGAPPATTAAPSPPAAAPTAEAAAAGVGLEGASANQQALPLRRLHLLPCRCGLAGNPSLQGLASCRQLQELSVMLHFNGDDASSWCAALQQLKALRRLAITIGRQPAMFAPLEQLLQRLPASLWALDWSYPSELYIGAHWLSRLSELRTLRLSGTWLSSASHHLAPLTALTAVQHNMLYSNSCATLRLPALQQLHAWMPSGDSLRALHSSSSLQALHIGLALPNSSTTLEALSSLTQLRQLSLGKLLRWRSEQVAAAGWGSALAALTGLQQLSLPQRLLVASRAREWLPALQQLQLLEVGFYDQQLQQGDSTTAGVSTTAAAAEAQRGLFGNLDAASAGQVQAAVEEVATSKVPLHTVRLSCVPEPHVAAVQAVVAAALPGMVVVCCVEDTGVSSPCRVVLE